MTDIDLRKLHEDVVFGRAGGKIIWQPRILAWFTEREYHKTPLPERYRGMTPPEIFRDLNCSNRNYDFNSCFSRKFGKNTELYTEKISETKTKHAIRSPRGEVYSVVETSPHSYHHIIRKWLLETPEDMKLYTDILNDSNWAFDQGQFAHIDLLWGERGAPTMFMPRVSVQDLYVDTMGVENAVTALYDWQDTVRDYFAVLHENHIKMIDIINSSPIKIINFGDNIHSATLSPRLYVKYVEPCYQERCARLHAHGRWVCAHWDGDVKPLLKYAKSSGLDGIEAITPKPQGDVTLEEIKAALGSEMFLVDGLPAVYFDELFSEQELIDCTKRIIELFAPNLILGISDEISPTGDLERIRIVGAIVDEYNASIETEG
ncbi:MAG: uroporphyrinogen decarboxylase family protein [Bacillota bacterium]